jgi:predicted dehydrogenase
MQKPIGVALVGFGMAGRTFHAPLIESADGLALRSVVSSQQDLVHAAYPMTRVTPDLGDALEDPDTALVVIATPNTLHAEQAIAALRAGKHVVVDKPFATSVRDAETILDVATRVGRIAVAFQNRRFDSDFLTLGALVHNGTLGDVVHMESHFDRYRPLVRDRWRERAGPGSGVWFDLGAHLVDQAVHLFGAPLAVTGDLMRQRSGAETDDAFHATLRYVHHRVIVRASSLSPAHSRRFTVHGTRGSFEKHGMDVQEAALAAGELPGSPDWGIDTNPGTLTLVDGDRFAERVAEGVPGDYGRFYAMVRDAIRGDAPPPVAPHEIVTVMRVLEAGVVSSADRREVALHPL